MAVESSHRQIDVVARAMNLFLSLQAVTLDRATAGNFLGRPGDTQGPTAVLFIAFAQRAPLVVELTLRQVFSNIRNLLV